MTDGRAQNVSYERGILFWADMDAKIRANSKGKKNLDDVIVPLITRARTQGGEAGMGNQAKAGGQKGWFTQAELVDSLAKFGGPAVRAQFDSVIMRGKMMVPAANAFGPCFALKPMRIPDWYGGSLSTPVPTSGPAIPDTDAYFWERVKAVPDSKCRKW